MPFLKFLSINFRLNCILISTSSDVVFFYSDMNVPFQRWDKDRIVSWFNEIGLNMYLAEVRRWCRNGDQLVKATSHDLEKVGAGQLWTYKIKS